METSRTNAQYKRNDRYNLLHENEFYLSYEFFSYDNHDRYDRYNDMETRLKRSFRFPFSLYFAKIATSSWFSQGSARPGNIDVVRVILGENFFYIAFVLVLC